MRRIRVFAAAVTTLALVAAPASATHGDIHPTFRTEQVYFHCAGPTKLHQANWVAGLGASTSYPRWDTTPPAGSAADGEGCGAADWGGTTNPVYSAIFTGTFTGNVRDLTVRIHQLITHAAGDPQEETLRLQAEIDGIPLFPPGAQPADGRTVTVTPVEANSGVTKVYEFTITNIGYANDVLDEQGNVVDVDRGGMAKEDGDGQMMHDLTITLGLHGTALSQDPAGHSAAMWVWDTTEVPSGITFNPPTPAAATVAADLP